MDRTFDREFELGHVKKESCSKWGKECSGLYLSKILDQKSF